MIDDAATYSVHRDTGHSWLGEIPQHWRIQSLGSLTTLVSRRGRPDLPLLSVVREKGVIVRSTMSDEENHNFIPDDLSNYKVVESGNLVINKMKAWQGSLGISPCDGIVSPAYFVLDLRLSNPRFAHTLLRSKPYVAFFAQASDGVRIGQWDLSPSMMKRIPVVIPPADEQDAIVRFLDHADRRIRLYIAAKKKLIALLNEQKQAIIQQAVTRGLEPDAHLRSSGISYLGEVPDHWKIVQLKRYWTVTDCKHLTVPFFDTGIPVASVREVQSFELSLRSAKRTNLASYEILVEGGRTPQPGDIIYCRNVSVGAAAFVNTLEQFAMGQDVCLLRSINQNQRYLNYFLQSAGMQRQLKDVLVGSTFDRINVQEIKALIVAVPPRDEQDDIVRYLDKNMVRFDDSCKEVSRGIDLLLEFRARLIADVVTGKLDVREAVANLPVELNEVSDLEDESLLGQSELPIEDMTLEQEAIPA